MVTTHRTFERLRTRAEDLIRQGRVDYGDLTGLRLEHEYQVQAAELHIQNEELRDIERELEKSRAEYRDLFEFAPVGYVVIGSQHLITAANAAAGELFEYETRRLVGIPLARFVSEYEAEAFELHRRKVIGAGGERVRARFTIVGKRGKHRSVLFESHCTDPVVGTWRTVLVDVTAAEGVAVLDDLKSALSTIAMSAEIASKMLDTQSPAKRHVEGLRQVAQRGAEAVDLATRPKSDPPPSHESGLRRRPGKRASVDVLAPDLALIVVAGEPDEGKIAAQYFRTIGFDALAVGDGFEALEVMKALRNRHVVVLADAELRSLMREEFAVAARALIPDVRITNTRMRTDGRGYDDVDFQCLLDAVMLALELPLPRL